MQETRRLTVLGGGSFGTAIANIAAENGWQVALWMRNEEAVQEILSTRCNSRYLPELKLHAGLCPTSSLEQALTGAEIVFFAIPSKSFRQVVQQSRAYLKPGQKIVSTTKGIEPGTLNLMSEVFASELPDFASGVMGGPNLAKEIAAHELTATVIASDDSVLRRTVQEALGCPYFRVYASADMRGVELGGALKNIYAIMAGVVAAKQLGSNTSSMLMTRGLAEMGRFAQALGANPMTFLGLAGVGDLIATCSSPLSRNYRVGYAFGQGKSLEQAAEELGETAEGVNTLLQVKRYSDEQGIYMPLAQALYQVVFEKVSLSQVINHMMMGEQNSDVEHTLPKDQI